MTKILTSLELLTVINELRALKGAKINKIYLPSPKQLLLVFHKPEGNYQLKIDSGTGVYLTSLKVEMPAMPGNFCLFLRKYLNNSILQNIVQKNTERIIELHFQTIKGTKILICELFSKGNFILTDHDYKIINVASVQVWKDRTVKAGQIYIYPPPKFNAVRLDKSQFFSAIAGWKSNEIVKLLASGIGLGGIYAEEVCKNTKVNKNTASNKLSEAEVEKLYSETQAIIYKFQKASNAQIVYEDSDLIDATPFKLNIYSDRTNKPAGSFNQALDVFYSQETTTRIKEEKSEIFNQKLQQLQTIHETQKQALEHYKEDYIKNQKRAENIYNNYQLISNIFNKIKDARDQGHEWQSIQEVLNKEKEQGVYEARLVRELVPEMNAVILDIDGELRLDLTKSLEQNAGFYYEIAKGLKSKIEGAQQTIDKTQKEIEDLRAGRVEFEQKLEQELPKPIKKVERKWYERFRWFFTSSGKLVIAGGDATTNDILVKKYLEVKDIIFHTEMAGSPFAILREGREKAIDKDKEEVAIATASFSRAWKSGVGVADVYWVLPEQVSKEAPAGQYLGKGAFMIRGRKNFLRNTILEISVGVDSEGRVMAGPRSAIARHCIKAVTVKPGYSKKSDTAKKIQQVLKVNLDEIMRALPAGEFEIVR